MNFSFSCNLNKLLWVITIHSYFSQHCQAFFFFQPRTFRLNASIWLFPLAASKNVSPLDQIRVLKRDVHLIWIITLLTLFRQQMWLGWYVSRERGAVWAQCLLPLCTTTTHHFMASSYRWEVSTSRSRGLTRRRTRLLLIHNRTRLSAVRSTPAAAQIGASQLGNTREGGMVWWTRNRPVFKNREHAQFEKTRRESIDRRHKVGGNRYVTLMDTGDCGSLAHKRIGWNSYWYGHQRPVGSGGEGESWGAGGVIGCFDSLEAVNGNYRMH